MTKPWIKVLEKVQLFERAHSPNESNTESSGFKINFTECMYKHEKNTRSDPRPVYICVTKKARKHVKFKKFNAGIVVNNQAERENAVRPANAPVKHWSCIIKNNDATYSNCNSDEYHTLYDEYVEVTKWVTDLQQNDVSKDNELLIQSVHSKMKPPILVCESYIFLLFFDFIFGASHERYI